jgi:hypothetical protein
MRSIAINELAKLQRVTESKRKRLYPDGTYVAQEPIDRVKVIDLGASESNRDISEDIASEVIKPSLNWRHEMGNCHN